jgi:hypothetical protein
VRRSRKASSRVPSVADEFAGADLGDARRTRRLESLVEAFSAFPDGSLPEIARDAAELEAFYRFFSNDAFQFEDLLAPHVAATVGRVGELPAALVVHDLTECSYSLDDSLRAGFARLGCSSQGFRLHAALALANDGSARPLGLLACHVWTDKVKGRVDAVRWGEAIGASSSTVAGRSRLIHVIDREGGVFELFARILELKDSFVIRLTKERLVELESGSRNSTNVQELAQKLESVHEIEVPLSRRTSVFPHPVNPPRASRVARLSFSAAPIKLPRPQDANRKLPRSIAVNLVCVTERDVPVGAEPVEWFLATTESIATVEDVIRVVEIYRARWKIEEFFKALKTGCALGKRQLESLDAVMKVLAISLVVAWRALLLRHESRHRPTEPASLALSELHLEVLRRTGRVPLGKKPSTRDALFAVAALGGHIKGNGDPGWLLLCRGMERLLERVVGWMTALDALGHLGAKCDR